MTTPWQEDSRATNGIALAVAGPIGPPGIPGVNGTNGTNGTNGSTGTAGTAGATGPTGPIGPSGGATGATGATGPQGPAGTSGGVDLTSAQTLSNKTLVNPIVQGNIQVGSASVFGGSVVLLGTPNAPTGSIGGTAGTYTQVNTLFVPAYQFEAVHSIRMGSYVVSQTVTTDSWNFWLLKDSTNIVRSVSSGSASRSAPMVCYDFIVPTNTATNYDCAVSRNVGTGTMTTSNDASLNYLQVTVRRSSV